MSIKTKKQNQWALTQPAWFVKYTDRFNAKG